MIDALKMIVDCEGITSAKSMLQGKNLENFRRSLRELAVLRINPVTIPKEWHIEHIPNLLDNYYTRLSEERERKKDEEFLKEYIRSCRKKGESLWR